MRASDQHAAACIPLIISSARSSCPNRSHTFLPCSRSFHTSLSQKTCEDGARSTDRVSHSRPLGHCVCPQLAHMHVRPVLRGFFGAKPIASGDSGSGSGSKSTKAQSKLSFGKPTATPSQLAEAEGVEVHKASTSGVQGDAAGATNGEEGAGASSSSVACVRAEKQHDEAGDGSDDQQQGERSSGARWWVGGWLCALTRDRTHEVQVDSAEAQSTGSKGQSL